MKKLLTLAAILMILFGSVSETFAAETSTRTVKVKKQPDADGTFADRLPSTCGVYPRIRRAWTTLTDVEIMVIKDTGKKQDETIMAFSANFTPDKGKGMCGSSMEITVMDCNMNTITKTLDLKPNKEGVYTASVTLPSKKGCALTLTSVMIAATSTDKEDMFFEANLDKLADGGGKDCKGNAKLKNVDFMTDNMSGFYVMSFSFGFDKELPAGASMLVQVTDCKGNNATVQVKLAYDASTGLAMGSAAIAQVKDCPWTLTYGEVYAIDPCGNEGTWSMDFSQVKTDGAGTRSTTGSTKNSRPKLK